VCTYVCVCVMLLTCHLPMLQEHLIERPAGKVFTQQTSEEARLHARTREGVVQHEVVAITLKNLPLHIQRATVAQHVMAHINTAMRRGSESVSEGMDECVSERVALRGVEVSIKQLAVRTRTHTHTHTHTRPPTASAVVHLQVSGTASRLTRATAALTRSLMSASEGVAEGEERTAAVSQLMVRLLQGLEIGRRVTVQGYTPK
jgi:hypothetical protein